MKKVIVEEKVNAPAVTGPRFFGWAIGILGIPFTGGLSLLTIPFTELGIRVETKNAAADLDRKVPDGPAQAARLLAKSVGQGSKGATVTYGAKTDGWGYVEKEVNVRVEQGQEEDGYGS